MAVYRRGEIAISWTRCSNNVSGIHPRAPSPTDDFLPTRTSPTKSSKHGDSSFPESTADVNGSQPSGRRARRVILFQRTAPVITGATARTSPRPCRRILRGIINLNAAGKRELTFRLPEKTRVPEPERSKVRGKRIPRRRAEGAALISSILDWELATIACLPSPDLQRARDGLFAIKRTGRKMFGSGPDLR